MSPNAYAKLPAAPGRVISTRAARLRIARDRCRSAIDARLNKWCGLPQPALSTRNSAQAACELALSKAVKGSRRNKDDAIELWKAAKKTCDMYQVPFSKAMDVPIVAGRTPLQHLVETTDHGALNFVHSFLPRGDYHGRIHLGRAASRKTGKKTATITGEGFLYYGQGEQGELDGYGVLQWPNGTTYVGTWTSYSRGVPDKPGYPRVWMAAGLSETTVHDLALCYGLNEKIVLVDPPPS